MLDRFAKLLGIRPDQAEDAIHSERAAKLVVSRRSFLGVGAALATGAIFSFGTGVEVVRRGSMLTSFDAVLKEIYSDDRIERLVYRANPFLGMITKVDQASGVITIGSSPKVTALAADTFAFKAGDSTPMSGS